jgi:hypothetical protein
LWKAKSPELSYSLGAQDGEFPVLQQAVMAKVVSLLYRTLSAGVRPTIGLRLETAALYWRKPKQSFMISVNASGTRQRPQMRSTKSRTRWHSVISSRMRRVQSATVGIRLILRDDDPQQTESARDRAAKATFLKQLRGKGNLFRLLRYEPWMSARSHQNLL